MRALTATGAVTSLLIGVGTIGGAVASSFGEAAPTVLLVLGMVICVGAYLLCLICIGSLLVGVDSTWDRVWFVAAVVGGPVLIYSGIQTMLEAEQVIETTDDGLIVIGAVGVV